MTNATKAALEASLKKLLLKKPDMIRHMAK